jgi:uncharacterized RDD family membrane protein YckC
LNDNHDNDNQQNNEQRPEFQSEPPAVPEQDNTANRMQRFLAAMIDGFLGMTVSIPLFNHYGIWDLMQTGGEIPTKVSIIMTAYSLIMFFVLHGLLLHRYGQTLGKRLMGLAIVMADGQRPSFNHLILNRYLPQWIAGLVPMVGPLLSMIDVLFIFRDDKRCVHDLIADTKVINLKIKTTVQQASLIV